MFNIDLSYTKYHIPHYITYHISYNTYHKSYTININSLTTHGSITDCPLTLAFCRLILFMGISTEQHRSRTGFYANVLASKPGVRKYVSFINFNLTLTALFYKLYRKSDNDSTRQTFSTLMSVFFLYFYLNILCFILSGQIRCLSSISNPHNFISLSINDKFGHSDPLRCLINWASITLLFLIYPKNESCIFSNIYRSIKTCYYKLSRSSYSMMSLSFLKINALFFVTIVNLALIVITTPSIVNPGPPANNIKVSYCNVQGFILMSSMKGNQPIFQTNKLLDFQSYLHLNKPDLAIVNETWLNEYINTNEIIDENYYKSYRLDRTLEDKAKYGKVGGSGIIILCKQDLDINTKLIKINSRLPILSIELKFKDNTKLCLSTFYRYGYSDLADYLEAEKYYRELCRKYKDVILLGDLNLSSVRDWSCPVAETELEEMYVDLFNDLGLIAQVNSSTHRAGNTLDQILTTRPNLVRDLSIIPDDMCPSDHYTLNFELHKPRNRKKTE